MNIKLPYGVSNFADLRLNGRYYVDKTAFIAPLEEEALGGPYVLFLRPRRFGKSLWLSTLESYYGISQARDFDALFCGLAVHKSPTPLRSSYLVLRLDFSPILTSEGPEALRTSFWGQVRAKLVTFLRIHEALFPSLGACWSKPERDRQERGAVIR